MTTEEPVALRTDDARAMWRDYTAGGAGTLPPEDGPPVEWFGDSPALADELLALLRARRAAAAPPASRRCRPPCAAPR
jgi:hypothetical protein